MPRHLDDAQQQTLKAALQAHLAEIEQRQARQLGGQSRVEHAREVLLQDGDDATQRDADREVDLAMTDRDVVEKAEVQAALQRLASGQYGVCADCDEPIPFERLKLEPQALRCIGCAEKAERLQPRHASM